MNFYHVCCQSLLRGNLTGTPCIRTIINSKHQIAGRIINPSVALQDVTPDKSTTTDILAKIKTSTSPLDLLGLISDPAFSQAHACSVMKYLGDFVKNGKIETSKLVTNTLYIENCRKIRTNIEKAPAFSLMLALQGLYKMDAESERGLIDSIQKNLMNTARLMNMRPLVALFILQIHNSKTESDKKLLRTVAFCIQRRWIELKNIDDMLSILRLSPNHFQKKFQDQLEDHLLEKVPSMTHTQITRTLSVLCKLKHRHLPLLTTLMHHLGTMENDLSLFEITTTLYAMCALTFPDATFLNKAANSLLRTIPHNNDISQIISLNTSIGILRWRNDEVLEAIDQWILDHSNDVNKQCIISYIMANATVQRNPHHEKIDQIIEKVLNIKEIEDEETLVDVVWAHLVLGKGNKEMVETIINKKITPKSLGVGRRLKFQQIIQWALLEGIEVPVLVEETALRQIETLRTKDNEALSNMTLAALRTFIPSPKHLREKITLPNGIQIDGEFAVEGAPNYFPVPVSKWYKEDEENPYQLPDGVTRICLCVWDFKATVLDSSDLSGPHFLTSKLLEKMGYKILNVTHAELSSEDKQVKKVQFLQRKLKQLMTS